MKFTLPLAGRCLMASMLACLTLSGIARSADLDIPRGSLAVDRDLVRVGMKSQLTWEIEYPAPITSVVDIVPPNVIKPRKNLKMKVRVLGASFQESILSFLPVEVQWSKNSASWSRIYYGLQTNVLPSIPVLQTNVKSGDTINFGGRGYRDGSWLPLYNTAQSTNNLIMLKNGDRVPSTVPALNGSSIESFLKPYMDTVTKKVKIGDRDLIMLMELGQTNTNNSGFDLQDLVVLVHLRITPTLISPRMKTTLILLALASASFAAPTMTDRITPEEIAARQKAASPACCDPTAVRSASRSTGGSSGGTVAHQAVGYPQRRHELDGSFQRVPCFTSHPRSPRGWVPSPWENSSLDRVSSPSTATGSSPRKSPLKSPRQEADAPEPPRSMAKVEQGHRPPSIKAAPSPSVRNRLPTLWPPPDENAPSFQPPSLLAGICRGRRIHNFIRQTQQETGVVWSMPVVPVGQSPSTGVLDSKGALFQLWTIESATNKDYLLDQKLVGAYLPAATITVKTLDPYTKVPRTRADQPFTVTYQVSGLLAGTNLPHRNPPRC